MAVLEGPVDPGTIRAFKGSIDFYARLFGPQWRWYARRWPLIKKDTVGPWNRWAIWRFRYFMKNYHLHQRYCSGYWRGMAQNIHWRPIDLAYKYFCGVTPLSLREIYFPLAKPINWIDHPQRYFRVVRFGLYRTEDAIWLRWKLEPGNVANALYMGAGPPTWTHVYKKRRGQLLDCGYQWNGFPDTLTELPAFPIDPQPAPFDDFGVLVWTQGLGWDPLFEQRWYFLTIRGEHTTLYPPLYALDAVSVGPIAMLNTARLYPINTQPGNWYSLRPVTFFHNMGRYFEDFPWWYPGQLYDEGKPPNQ